MTQDQYDTKTPEAHRVPDTHGVARLDDACAPFTEEDSTMSDIQITPEMMAQAQELAAKLKLQQATSTAPPTPTLPLAVTLAIGLANAITKTEDAAKSAKDSAKGFAAQFKAAYRAQRPVTVKSVEAKDVSPEELAAAVEILKAQQNNQ